MMISQDLRIRSVQQVANGTSRRQAVAHFTVSVSTTIRFAHKYDTVGPDAVSKVNVWSKASLMATGRA